MTRADSDQEEVMLVGRRKVLQAGVLGSALAGMGLIAAGSVGADESRARPHPLGHTEGFGNVKVLDFRYDQQFFCTDEATDDLDGPGHNGDGLISAQDPDEFQVPAVGPPGSPCIVGETAHGSLPRIDPTGRPVANSEPVWAILPFFDGDNDGVIDAVDPTPPVHVQCPEPGPPYTQHKGVFGTCTMHPSSLHGEPAGLSDIPLPNHSHVIDGDSFNPIWWQTIAVRVFDRSIWPDPDGRCPANPQGGRPCLTSLQALRDAQGRGQAGPDVPTNVWLFFDSRQVDGL
jgi:hypothetical protein